MRIAARLNLGFLLGDAGGNPAFPVVNQTPLLFLWIELWKPRILFPHETVNWTVESLKRKGSLGVQPQAFFLPPGVYKHRTLGGTPWIIDVIARDEFIPFADGEPIILRGHKRFVFACQSELADKFRAAREREFHWNFVNLFTPIGLGWNVEAHLHFSMTDSGRENASISASDLISPDSVGPETPSLPTDTGGPAALPGAAGVLDLLKILENVEYLELGELPRQDLNADLITLCDSDRLVEFASVEQGQKPNALSWHSCANAGYKPWSQVVPDVVSREVKGLLIRITAKGRAELARRRLTPGAAGGQGTGNTGREHRDDTKPKLTRQTKLDTVSGFLDEYPHWKGNGTLEELSAEIKSKRRIEVSDSWLCRHQKKLGLAQRGNPRRPAKGKNQREAVSGEADPSEQLEAYTMSD